MLSGDNDEPAIDRLFILTCLPPNITSNCPETGSWRFSREHIVTIINNEYLKIISTVVLSDLLGVGVGWSPYL